MLIAEMPEIGTITGEQAAATHWISPVAALQRNSSRETGHSWRSPCPAARDVPGGTGRGTSQRNHESLRRSPPQAGKPHKVIIAGRRQKARHRRERPSARTVRNGRHGSLTDTVARQLRLTSFTHRHFRRQKGRGDQGMRDYAARSPTARASVDQESVERFAGIQGFMNPGWLAAATAPSDCRDYRGADISQASCPWTAKASPLPRVQKG